MSVNATRLAWLAGIVDGEGTISIYSQPCHHIRKDGTRSLVLKAWLCVVNTNEHIIHEVTSILDEIGVTYYVGVHSPVLNRKTVWRVALTSGKQVVPALKAILPYLVGKAEQARLVIETSERKAQFRKGSAARAFSHEERAWLNGQLAQIRALNKVGSDANH